MNKKRKQKRPFRPLKRNAARRVLVTHERHFSPSLCNYVLSNSGEIDVLSRYILDYPNIETGGQLFGYWTYDGKPVVLFVLGPGLNAGHHNTFFMQDLTYLKACATVLMQKYGLDHIGEWHSHHQLGLDHPSGHDAHNISSNMRKLGYSRFLLCIGTCTNSTSSINAFMFTSSKQDFERIPWKVKDIDSPFRKLIFQNDSSLFLAPQKKSGNMVNLWVLDGIKNQKKIEYEKTYWMKKGGASMVLKAFLENLRSAYQDLEFVPTIDGSQQVHIEVYSNGNIIEDIHFPMGFPNVAPIISPIPQNLNEVNWNHDNNLVSSLMIFYKNLKHVNI